MHLNITHLYVIMSLPQADTNYSVNCMDFFFAIIL